MPKNVPSEVYSAIVQGLVKDKDWSVEDQNFERYDTIEGTQDAGPITTADGDYPRAMLEGPISFETKLWTTGEVFATHTDDEDGQHPPPVPDEEGSLTFRLTVISGLLKMSLYTGLESNTINAIRKLGPKLGLKYVTSVTASGTSKEERDQDNGTKRITTVILVVVKYAIDGDELTGE